MDDVYEERRKVRRFESIYYKSKSDTDKDTFYQARDNIEQQF